MCFLVLISLLQGDIGIVVCMVWGGGMCLTAQVHPLLTPTNSDIQAPLPILRVPPFLELVRVSRGGVG